MKTAFILSFFFITYNSFAQTSEEKIGTAVTKGLEILNIFKKPKTATNTKKTETTNKPIIDNEDQKIETDSIVIVEPVCKCYVNFTNKTENRISVTVYLENPHNNSNPKKLTTITLAIGNSKKVKIEKDIVFYYSASNNTGDPVIGGYQSYSGDVEAEKCGEIVEEEIQ